jgi:hypothetical protein
MASDRNLGDRLWITPGTDAALTASERDGLSLLVRAYNEDVRLHDAPNPLTPELAKARRLFHRRRSA